MDRSACARAHRMRAPSSVRVEGVRAARAWRPRADEDAEVVLAVSARSERKNAPSSTRTLLPMLRLRVREPARAPRTPPSLPSRLRPISPFLRLAPRQSSTPRSSSSALPCPFLIEPTSSARFFLTVVLLEPAQRVAHGGHPPKAHQPAAARPALLRLALTPRRAFSAGSPKGEAPPKPPASRTSPKQPSANDSLDKEKWKKEARTFSAPRIIFKHTQIATHLFPHRTAYFFRG